MSGTRRYRFGPLEKRTVAGPLRAGQALIAGTAALLAMLAGYGLPSALGLAVAVSILGAAALVLLLPVGNRGLDEWVPVAWRWGLRAGRGADRYSSASPSGGNRSGASRMPAAPSSLPAELCDLEMLEVPYREATVGVICDRRAGTYTAAMAARGAGFGLGEPSEQERKLEGWGAVLASPARDGSPVRRLQWVERTLPSNGDELAGYLQSERDSSVPFASEVVRSYIELIEAAAPASQEHEALLALQVDQRRGGREIKRLGGGDDAACRILLREAEALAERLTIADLTVYGVLRPRQYARVIRDGFDPYGRRARNRLAVLDPGREGTEPQLMGPLGAQETWSTYRSDSALHASYWISAWPRSEVGATFLAPLLMQTSVLRSVAVTIEPVPFRVAVRKAEAARTAQEADEIQRARQGFTTTARARRRQDAIAWREDEIAAGHAEMRFAGYLTVSAQDAAELQQSCAAAEHAAQLSRLELQRLYGEQAMGFSFTLPLARGLV